MPAGDAEVGDERLAASSHGLRDAGEVTLLPRPCSDSSDRSPLSIGGAPDLLRTPAPDVRGPLNGTGVDRPSSNTEPSRSVEDWPAMESYGQYCPISRSAEVLGDRWTILIIRDLMTGTTRFNELIRGNPGLSRAAAQPPAPPAAGRRHRRAAGRRHHALTDAGRDLEPVVFGLATWGARWTFGEPVAEELDPDLLLWWLHRQMDPTKLPEPWFTVYVPFTDHPKRYWIVVEQDPSLCLADPGFEVDVTLRADRASLYRTYLGQVSLADAQRSGHVQLDGSQKAVRAFVYVFHQSPVASIVAAQTP